MQVTIEQAIKEAVDFPKAKGLVPSHRLAPRIMVAYAEIRDLPARGNQSMTSAEYKSTQPVVVLYFSESPSTLPDSFVSRHTHL
jgi:hypothetical protein